MPLFICGRLRFLILPWSPFIVLALSLFFLFLFLDQFPLPFFILIIRFCQCIILIVEEMGLPRVNLFPFENLSPGVFLEKITRPTNPPPAFDIPSPGRLPLTGGHGLRDVISSRSGSVHQSGFPSAARFIEGEGEQRIGPAALADSANKISRVTLAARQPGCLERSVAFRPCFTAGLALFHFTINCELIEHNHICVKKTVHFSCARS